MVESSRSWTWTVIWLWRRGKLRIVAASLISLALLGVDLLHSGSPGASSAVLAAALLAAAIGSTDPAKLRLSQRLPASWQDYFWATRLMLLVTGSPFLLAAVIFENGFADKLTLLVRLFCLMAATASIVADWASVVSRKEIVYFPALTTFLLIHQPQTSASEARLFLVYGFVVVVLHSFARSQALRNWQRSRVTSSDGETAPWFEGREETRPFGEASLWILLALWYAVFSIFTSDFQSGAYSSLLVSQLLLLGKSRFLLATGRTLESRLRISRHLGKLAWVSAFLGGVVYWVFQAFPGILRTFQETIFDRRGVAQEEPVGVLITFFWYLAILVIWGMAERKRIAGVEFWGRQLELMRRMPVSRADMTKRLLAAMWPVIVRSTNLIVGISVAALILSFVSTGTAQGAGFLLGCVLATLLVATHLMVALGILVLRFRYFVQLIAGFAVLYLFVRLAVDVHLLAAVGSCVVLSLLAIMTIYLCAVPAGVLASPPRSLSG